jgi:hypothetical protein
MALQLPTIGRVDRGADLRECGAAGQGFDLNPNYLLQKSFPLLGFLVDRGSCLGTGRVEECPPDRLWLLARHRCTTASAVANDILDKALPRFKVEREG